MLSINTDVNSIKIRNYMSGVTNNLNSCTKKLSTGKKLNTASDDAAGLYLSEGINARIRSYNIGIQAAQTGVAILNIAESAINQITQNVLRARDISVQASSDYYTQDARNAMQGEVDELLEQIQMEKDGCNFNGKQLLAAGTPNQIAENPTGGGISAFQQLTIDDFTNIQTSTLESLCQYNPDWAEWYGYTYEDYENDITSRGATTVEFRSGEKDGQRYYFIENADQLKVAANGFSDFFWENLYSGNFVFLSDIDLNGVEWENYNNSSTIDGNGHKITNYNANLPFVQYNCGIIKNLGMENCSASGDCSAILCYENYNGGSITDCYVTDSTVNGNDSAILCYDNVGVISNCYVADSTVSGNGSAILCWINENSLENTYAMNITADEGINYMNHDSSPINNYQNHNESDTTSTYKPTEWFATDEAVTALGNAFELVEGNDHPTLKSNPEPVPPTPPEPSGEKMRIQVGEDASASSFIEIDLGFDLGTLSIDLSTTEGAVKAIEDIDKLLTVLNNKQSEIGAVFNRLESVAMSNTMGVENMSAGLSTIVDADIAKLNSEYVKNQILQNASSALMVQASNLNREVVLGLLRNL